MNKNLLIIGLIWPEPNTTAAGIRMLQLIKIFKKNGFTITFVSSATRSNKSFPLEQLGIQTYDIRLNDSHFDNLVKQIDPNIVLFDRFLSEEQFGWRIAENCPKALRILDTEDLHFLRHARHQAFKKNQELTYFNLINDHTKRELASIYRCDISLIISKFEHDLLINTFHMDTDILLYIPFLMDPMELTNLQASPDFQERKNFMCIGNFKHAPNWHAVLYLKNSIWPLLRKELPHAQLHIFGGYITDKVKQLHHEKEGFIIKGWAENAEDTFKVHKICLAPLQFGAGLKGKLIDAMRYGTPSITTKIGAEAMHDDLPWNGFITDDPTEFIEKSVALYQNETLWKQAQQNGISIINQCYDIHKYENIFMDKITQLVHKLKQHRLKNFIGAMLQHETLKSTKYMSKWIEEKNR